MSFIARVTGGVGVTCSSCQSTASLSVRLGATVRQGIGRHFGSLIQGCWPTTVLAHNMISSRDWAIGPLTLFTASWPASPERVWKFGNRPDEGLMVKIPVHAAGIRREPPINERREVSW